MDGRMDLELEALEWEKRQLALRRKYADTPPGLRPSEADAEEQRQSEARRDWEHRMRLRITSVAPLPAEPFAGRREELSAIREHFAGGGHVLFLSGIGGIGKSALARAYGRECSADVYEQVVFWSCEYGLAEVLEDDGQLGIFGMAYSQSQYRSRRQYVQEKFRNLARIAESGRILFLLDNLRLLEDPWLAPLLELPGDFLITTRLSVSVLQKAGYTALAVESLSRPEDWEEFFRLYGDRTPEPEEQRRLLEYRDAVLGHTLKMKLALRTDRLWTADRLSRSILNGFRLKRAEIQTLCELSWFTLLGIPEDVFRICSDAAQDGLDPLKSYSLVQERQDAGGRTFLYLHPVISEAVKTNWHPGLTKCSLILQRFARYARFSWYRPREGDQWLTAQVFEVLRRLPPPRARNVLLYESLGTFLMVWEYFTEALDLFQKLIRCVEKERGENHADAYLSMRVANCLYDQLRYEESREWFERSCKIYRTAKPENSRFSAERAEACEKLARIYTFRGEFARAHSLVDEAMEAMRDFRRETETAEPEVWREGRRRWQYVWLRRSRIFVREGNPDAAQAALNRGWELFPLEHAFDEVDFLSQQVRIDLLRGELDRAEENARRSLELCVTYQGETYKDSLTCRERLGDVLAAQGKREEAEEAYLQILAQLQEHYPYQTDWSTRLRKKLHSLLMT